LKIPSKVKIGAHWLDVVYKTEKDDGYESSGTRMGLYDKIILQDEMIRSKQEETLLHEVIHEIGDLYGLELVEKQVYPLGESFYQVLADNDFSGQIPPSVKIGAHQFTIDFRSYKEDRYGNDGTLLSQRAIIIIQKDIPESKQMKILFARILNEIDFQHNLELGENRCLALAEALYQFLIDNELWYRG